ncbi:hypothetical protein F907_00829 [Acinetobacter colistiniresistens]|uniref:Uncharacterized protein n=1 Tax=Acinetobacter colistiniresistens TaxID=280145 RepID=S3TD69_9GAMM|nr:hypothetical protein [Acinetobacter colistiniresistens]EPG39526.1 hypothetical protein F907_00829 [Acinetobacter colistiniresistens]
MTSHKFLLTYSVSPTETTSDTKKKLADKVRDKIADIEIGDWKKAVNVETTFAGTIDVTGVTNKEKWESAAKEVKRVMEQAYRDCEATTKDVAVNYAMLLSNAGEAFSFKQ